MRRAAAVGSRLEVQSRSIKRITRKKTRIGDVVRVPEKKVDVWERRSSRRRQGSKWRWGRKRKISPPYKNEKTPILRLIEFWSLLPKQYVKLFSSPMIVFRAQAPKRISFILSGD